MQWLGPWYGTACSSDWLSFSFSRKYFWTIWGPISSKNTFSNHGMQLKIQNKYFQCCISRTHWVLLMGMAVSCRKSIIFRKSKGQRQFSFSASQKQSLFSASLKQCFFWQVSAKFPLATSSACLEAVNQAIYWSTHFLSISPSSFSMMLLKHIISLNFVNFNLRYRIWCFKLLSILFLSLRYYHWRHLFEANWSRYYLTFSLLLIFMLMLVMMLMFLLVLIRHESCQKIYTTGFLGKK